MATLETASSPELESRVSELEIQLEEVHNRLKAIEDRMGQDKEKHD